MEKKNINNLYYCDEENESCSEKEYFQKVNVRTYTIKKSTFCL